jgi:hypothetical protein
MTAAVPHVSLPCSRGRIERGVRQSELDAPFGAPLPSLGEARNRASRPFEAELSCRCNDDSDANCVAGTKKHAPSCPRSSRASRQVGHSALSIEIAGTSPAMTFRRECSGGDEERRCAGDDKHKEENTVKGRRQTRRSFPGRLTLEEWLELPYLRRRDLIWRARCELLGCERYCASTMCRRHRTCCGDDPMSCERRLWHPPRPRPKTFRRELVRIDRLSDLRGPGPDASNAPPKSGA